MFRVAPLVPGVLVDPLLANLLRALLALPSPLYLPVYILVPAFLVLFTQLLQADYLLLTLIPAAVALLVAAGLWIAGWFWSVEVRWPQPLLSVVLAFLLASHFLTVLRQFGAAGYGLLLASSCLTLLQSLPSAMLPPFP
jgi:hypothetical protein